MTTLQATRLWVKEFNFIPGTVIEKMAQGDVEISCYDSDTFRLIASPKVECGYCWEKYDGVLSLAELLEAEENGEGISCENCYSNFGDCWVAATPEYAFPCGWGTLFSLKERLDTDWILEHRDEVAGLGFFVFESDDYDVILGIDAGGFDFYESYWIPLYKLRGLQWHDKE